MGTGHPLDSLCGPRWWVPRGLVLWPRGALPSGHWWPSGAPLLAVSSSSEITYLQFFSGIFRENFLQRLFKTKFLKFLHFKINMPKQILLRILEYIK